MDVFLYFPPMEVSAVAFPYPSMAALAGYVGARSKHRVVCKDVNADFVNCLARSAAVVGGRKARRSLGDSFAVLAALKRRHVRLVDLLEILRFGTWRWRYPNYYSPGLHRLLYEMTVLASRVGNLERDAIAALAVELKRPDLTYDSYVASRSRTTDADRPEEHYLLDPWSLTLDQVRVILTSDARDPVLAILGPEYLEQDFEHLGGRRFIIGFSVAFATQFGAAVALARFIKRRFSTAFVVLGGAFVRRITSRLPCIPEIFDVIDCFVEGPGEEVLLGLANRLENGEAWSRLPGLIHRDSLRRIIQTDVGRPDTGTLCVPDYSWVSKHKYIHPSRRSMRSSFGCYWNKCRFCTLAERDYLPRDIDIVVEEMRQISSGPPVLVQLVDDGIHISRLCKIAERLVATKSRVYWGASTRFDSGFVRKRFNDEVCRLLIRSGCLSLGFGLESASQRMNDRMNKGVDLEDARRVLDLCRKYALKVNVGTIIGFPGETEAEASSTVEFIRARRSLFFGGSTNLFSLEQGSYVFEHPEQFGVTEITDSSAYLFKQSHQYRANDKLPQSTLRRVCKGCTLG